MTPSFKTFLSVSLLSAGIIMPSAVFAQDPREACRDDTHAFCGNVHPGGGRIVDCLQEHYKDLSDNCYAALQNMKSRGQGPGPGQGNNPPPPPQGNNNEMMMAPLPPSGNENGMPPPPPNGGDDTMSPPEGSNGYPPPPPPGNANNAQ